MNRKDTSEVKRAAALEEPVVEERAVAVEETASIERADIDETPEAGEQAAAEEASEQGERAATDKDSEPGERLPQEIPTGEIIWAPVPQPLPYKWRIGATPSGHVALEIITPLGSFHFVLEPADARQMGAAIIKHGQEADAVRQVKTPLLVTDKMPTTAAPGR